MKITMKATLSVLLLGVLTLMLAGCDKAEPGSIPLKVRGQVLEAAPKEDQHRFTVELADYFRDELAYHDYRGVYIITDTQTGRQFVGISGVGISELGRHQTGKTSSPDER